MIIDTLKYVGSFLLLVLLQVLILNNIQISGYINPYLYILFIITLPIHLKKWAILVIAFVLGICIDMFCNTGGLHAAATLLIAYVRQPLLELFSPREGFNATSKPDLNQLGVQSFLYYALAMTSIHHLFFFFLEEFSFSEFFRVIFRSILSILFTMILIMISQYIRFDKSEK